MSWKFLPMVLILGLGQFGGTAHARANETRNNCCNQLSAVLPSKVAFRDSPTYDESLSSYWSQQEQLIHPSCVFSPTGAEEISLALAEVLVPRSCFFAVRGGGHGSVPATANIQDGVTIDLRGLNDTSLSDDGLSVSVGPGQEVGRLYSILAQHGLAAAGARAATIGVGGSTLGGGIGFLYPITGFACDKVIEFEVVLANGTIVTASEDLNSDLFRALKGGGSNFGIVTRFVMSTFELGDIWAGDVVYSSSAIDEMAPALAKFVSTSQNDPKASALVTYHFTSGSEPIIAAQYIYAEPDISATSAFDDLLAVRDQMLNSTGSTTLSAYSVVHGSQSPIGYQQITFSFSFDNGLEMLLKAWDIFTQTVPSIEAVEGISWSLTLEPIGASMANAGNVIGLKIPSQGLIMAICSITFTSATDYTKMKAAGDSFLDELTASAEDLGVLSPWIDMNHAGAGQDVLAGYGPENLAFLTEVAEKYDEYGVFQTLKPGGFKL